MNLRIALLLFLAPVFLALLYTFYTWENKKIRYTRLAHEGMVALYDGGEVTREDLRQYLKTPPTEDSPILRGLEMTAEDVAGLETEDPAWFEGPPGQLLVSRVIKHIALIEILNAQDEAPIQKTLQQDVNAHREQLMVEAMEDELETIKPNITQEEMMAYYVEHSDEFFQEGRRLARHIMLEKPSGAPQSASAENPSVTPEFIINQIRLGADFQHLLRYSQSESIHQDGYLGWVSQGALAEPLEEALWSMRVGEIRGPIPINNSLHIIHLVDVQKEGLKPFRKAIPEIREILQRKKSNLHRFKLLGLSTDPLAKSDPSQSAAYRQALLDAAYARGWDDHKEIQQRVQLYRRYHKADLMFLRRAQALKNAGGFGSPNQSSVFIESETINRLLNQYEFHMLVQFDLPTEASLHDFH